MTQNVRTIEEELLDIQKTYDNPRYWHTGLNGDGYGQGYQDYPTNSLRADYIISLQPKSVLEVGCAYGHVVRRLLERGIEASGVDISNYAVAQAQDAVKPNLLGGVYAHKMPFADRQFDLLCCFGMMEHVPDVLLKQTIAEFDRVARRVVISCTMSSEDNVRRHEHPGLRSWREWKALLPPHFRVMSDADELWKARANQNYVIISTGIMPAQLHGRYGGVERLAALFAKGMSGRGRNIFVVAPQGSVLPHGCTLVPSGPPLMDFTEPGLQGAASSIIRDKIPTCIDFSHSRVVNNYSYFASTSIIWHDPLVEGVGLPRRNIVSLSNWQNERLKARGREGRVCDPICADQSYYTLGPGGERFVAVGKMHPTKGNLEAARLCRQAGVGLDIIGPVMPGDPPEYLQAVIAECKASGGNIIYHGEVDDDAKRDILQRSAALVYPVSYPEGLGEAHSHKGVEAMMCGTPFIAYDQGAMREVVDEGVTGLVARQYDAQDFIEKLRVAASLDRKKVRNRAMLRWSLPAVMDRWMKMLVEVQQGDAW